MGADIAKTASIDTRTHVANEQSYLLVIENGQSFAFDLPEIGVVNIGRQEGVELRLDHSSVSRHHARIIVEGGVATLSDLDSHNGTRVNGGRIEQPRQLTPGDVVLIGEVVAVVHARARRTLVREPIEQAAWRHHLQDEIERALTFRRPLALVAVLDCSFAEVTRALRPVDRACAIDGTVFAILPEADPAVAARIAGSLAIHARVGIATCPHDAIDVDDLVLGARSAAHAARQHDVATVADATRRIALGDREAVFSHPTMLRVYELLERLANSTLSVLVLGESGVGKDHAAFAIHHHSVRRSAPFVAINCAAIPEQLVESQLFGHDKGAFTGATTQQVGLFESANGGTVFLDEVGELSLPIQAKLLRVLQDRRITRLGENKERQIDVRFVAATNRVLEEEVTAGRFREDVFYRLGAAKVLLPPLRDRMCEVPVLFHEFLTRATRRIGRSEPRVSPEVMQALLTYRWPGNTRELMHLAEYLAAIAEDQIDTRDLPPDLVVPARTTPAAAPATGMRRLSDELEDIERTRMAEALVLANGVKKRAAEILGMPLRTFALKVKQHGLG